LIASTAKALLLAEAERESRYAYVAELNQRLCKAFKRYPKVRINSTQNSIPFILNISIAGAKSEAVQAELEAHEIYVSTKSACCAPNTVSRPVYALTKDKKAALSTLRISISHLTAQADIQSFLDCFDDCYNKLVK
jgi:cysteine desulfurase